MNRAARARRRGARGLALATALLASGCGPSVATLLQRNQVNEAFCRARDERDAALVIPAMIAKLGPSWRVREVLASDLKGLDPAFAKDLFSKYALLIVERRARADAQLELHDLAGLRSIPEGHFASAGLMVGADAFAGLTGESVPAPQQETTSRLAHPQEATSWAFMTLGLSLIFADRVTQTETRYPTDAELRAAAPHSAALRDAIARAFGPNVDVAVLARGPGTHAFLVEDQILVGNQNGELGATCGVDLRVDVEGAPFELGAPTAFPAGEEFQPFTPQSWTQANITMPSQYGVFISGPAAKKR